MPVLWLRVRSLCSRSFSKHSPSPVRRLQIRQHRQHNNHPRCPAMLHRNSKPAFSFIKWIRKGAAILFVAEAGAFGVSYLVWARMNTDRDFRQYMSTSFPSILNGYYSLGEYLSGGSGLRHIDTEYWKHAGPPPTPSE